MNKKLKMINSFVESLTEATDATLLTATAGLKDVNDLNGKCHNVMCVGGRNSSCTNEGCLDTSNTGCNNLPAPGLNPDL